MTNAQHDALNERLDRIEAAQRRIEERIDLWRGAIEPVQETMRQAADRLLGLPRELGVLVGKNAAKAIVDALGPKALKNAIARRGRA